MKEDLISKAQAHRGDLGLGDLDEGDREVRVLRRGFQRPPGLNAGATGPEGQMYVTLEGLAFANHQPVFSEVVTIISLRDTESLYSTRKDLRLDGMVAHGVEHVGGLEHLELRQRLH